MPASPVRGRRRRRHRDPAENVRPLHRLLIPVGQEGRAADHHTGADQHEVPTRVNAVTHGDRFFVGGSRVRLSPAH